MRIAVFGDSFAPKFSPNWVWWKQLRQFGHEVTCYGESGSSINFSAQLINQNANSYDINIWCLTTVGRFSVKVNDQWIHLTTNSRNISIFNEHIIDAVDSYHKYLFDWSNEIFTATAIVEYLCNKFKNILVVPCFSIPLFIDQEHFNLFTVSEREAANYFPNQSLSDIYNHYNDIRAAHLSKENNKVLAQLINDNLQPGVFSVDYNEFVSPEESVDTLFQKKL